MGIDRIPLPTAERFYQQYMCRQRPVVITDLFNGQPLGAVRSKADAINAFGAISLPLQDVYDDAIRINDIREHLASRLPLHYKTGETPDLPAWRDKTVSLKDYFTLIESPHNRHMLRVAFATCHQLQRAFTVPEVCRPRQGESTAVLNQNFIGVKGSFSAIHFDKDGLHAFLYAIFGRKRFIVFPHTAREKLLPFTQFSGWALQNFTERDRQAFLTWTGGEEVILQPGEAIYFPPFAWHFADYLDDCWALNLRFRRKDSITALLNCAFPDSDCQALGVLLLSTTLAPETEQDILTELARLTRRPFRDGRQKTRYIRRRIARLLQDRDGGPGCDRLAWDLERYIPSPLAEYLDWSDARRPRFR
ncbi:Glutamine phosphoribosylpyrophosphate amidotransferase [Sodalis praecaptivus]|uniref:Glutamine phosphoribosylpyrophosphate amidotransferase n=1 Tax=Sodalis praecaptivus TaxID=1239307 RepID=W0HUL4_9GAMM|nr:cupin-like domain-containing protein [Sodalis praecaptivus]AHF75900.1 Glutamine phosphoribosylpyrophosphate amidotransferase [Sodalis praecaptivus]